MIVTNSLTGGGAERSMNLLSNEFTKQGWEVLVVTANSGPEDLVRLVGESYCLNRNKLASQQVFSVFKAVWRFNFIVKKWNPDVVILNCDFPELLGATTFGNFSIFVVEHSSKPWGKHPLMGRVVRKVLRYRNSIWVGVSNHLTIWPRKESASYTIENPIINMRDSSVNCSSQMLKRLVFIGRLSPEKGALEFLKIVESANVEALVIGDGAMKLELEAKASHFEARAQFTGQVLDPWNLICDGDLLIVPSKFEGDGLVVLEAIREGVPLLLSDIQDLRRFNFPTTNYCDSVASFIEKIERYSTQLNSLKIAEEDARLILEARGVREICDKWIKILTIVK